MEIVNLEANVFYEMYNALLKTEEQLNKCHKPITNSLDDWLDSQEACILLGISKQKLTILRETGYLPFSRIDRRLYYHRKDLLEFLKQNLM